MPLSATAVAASSSRRRGVSVEARVGASVAARVGHLEWGVDQVGRDDRRVEHRVLGKSVAVSGYVSSGTVGVWCGFGYRGCTG